MPRRHVTSTIVVERNVNEITPLAVYGPNTAFDGLLLGSLDPSAMIVRSQWEVANEGAWPAPHVMKYGGEHEQCWPGVARWDADPEVVMWSHDIGGHWVSLNGGRTTRHARSKGFKCVASGALAMHPVTGRVICLALSNYLWQNTKNNEGIYTSDDFGETWTFRHLVISGQPHGNVGQVYNAADDYVMRSSQEAIVFDKWWVPDRVACAVGGNGVFTSTDAGITWTKAIDLAPIAGVRDVYRIVLSRKTQGRAFLACAGRGDGTAADKHAGLWRIDNLWGTPSMTVMADGLPDPANNVFTADIGNGKGHIRWIDFANPTTQDGDLIVSSVEYGVYRIPMSASHLSTGSATIWLTDTLVTKLTVATHNPLVMGRFSKALAPTPRRLRTTVDGGTSWVNTTVHEQPASWRTGGWKTQVGAQWDTSTWHPTRPELLFHSSAMNWLCTNIGGLTSDVVPCNDYIGGWNSAGGWTRSDFTATPGLSVQGFQDHGVALSKDNGLTHIHLNSPANPEMSGAANATSAGCAVLPGSRIVFAAIGDHSNQQDYRGDDYDKAEAVVWNKIGDTDGNGSIGGIEPVNNHKDRMANFFLPGTNYWYSGNQRSIGTNPAGHNGIGGGDIVVYAEMIGYTKVAKIGAAWVVWAGTLYAGGTGNHLRGRAIWRGTVNPATGTNAITWDDTLIPYYFAPSAGTNLFSYGLTFSPDHNNVGIIYVRDVLTGDIARWNGTTFTPLGLITHPALAGDDSWNSVSAIAIDPVDTDYCICLTRQPGFPMVWVTENLTAATPIWTPAENFSHLGTGSVDVDPHTGERIYDGPFGRFCFPPPFGVDRGNPLRGNNGVRYSEVDWTA